MILRKLLALGKSSRSRTKPRRPVRRAWELERLEDRCLPASCFSRILTIEHTDLAFDYANSAWDAAVEIGNTFPTTQHPPEQTLLWVDPQAQLSQPAGPQWSFLGAGPGNPVWILPQSQDSRLLYLGGAAEDTPAGTFARYFESDPRVGASFAWIKWSLRAVRGPGHFALYQTNFDGSPLVWMSTADGIGTDDVTFIPEQGHAHFNWAFSRRGFYEIDLQASAFLNDGLMTPTASPVVTFYFAVDPVLQVTSLVPTATGFVARLNRPFEPGVLNLYDDSITGLGPADVTLVGPSGREVRGSLVIEGINCVRFVRTGGVLEPGGYTATLRSAADGFKTTSLGTPSMLDGNGDGTPGDPFVRSFTITPAATVTMGVPDVARGPGQPVNVPAMASGLPLQLRDGSGITAIALTLRYDPALLNISGVSRGPALPATAQLNFTNTPGRLVLSITSSAAPLAGPLDLVLLSAQVPAGAAYTAKQVLDIDSLQLNNGTVPALDDDGIHVVGYPGDTTGNGGYTSLDAVRALRVAVGLDAGFGAYQLADPMIVADISGNSAVSSADAIRILQEVVGINRPEIPPLPAGPPPIVPGGPDPLLRFPVRLWGRRGRSIVVPLTLDTSEGLQAADLAISYDSRRLRLLEVRRGGLTGDFDLFQTNVDQRTGTLRVALGRTVGPITGRGSGSVLWLRFRIRDHAPPGQALINLRRGVGMILTNLNEGGLTLTPTPDDAAGDALDGVITVAPTRSRRRPPHWTDGSTTLTNAVPGRER